MSVDYIFIMAMWVSGVVAYMFLTPKNQYRKLLFSLLTCQALLWINSLVHVEFNLLAFPVREFPKATDLLITTEYFFYPLLCGLYIAYEPKRSFKTRLIYLSVWISFITVYDVILVKYTNLVEYVHYAWYFTWIDFFCIFAVTNLIYQWIFKNKELFRIEQEAAE
ncbi:CBO0543 family protein [Neobacillus sp. SuZ13]|uniref:CBO0543 family protein n=1 Tax=Neobacillus sp. SuZ13 TaxID=3047875 RepID=UPI0024BFF80F|nr:CBO0543 family protein [Neobacillus sp. SuZ13]WHY66805.1 CBO0543 family protein [Neobacillus sp. SuZ13]